MESRPAGHSFNAGSPKGDLPFAIGLFMKKEVTPLIAQQAIGVTSF
jgi:hypothetical protein